MTHVARVDALLGSGRARRVRPPRDVAWPVEHREPPDLAALYARCDGLELDDGATILGRGELAATTSWLVLDRGLDWPGDWVVVGERGDAVVVLDLDVEARRAGGGVLEIASDDLGAPARVATDVVGWALARASVEDALAAPPEVAAAAAARARDRATLRGELARPFYPGASALEARLWLSLGELELAAGAADDAWAAFERSVEARVSERAAASREREARAAWGAVARACSLAGHEEHALRAQRAAVVPKI